MELLHSRKGPPLHTHTLQDGAILYRSKLTLRPDVAWNQYRNELCGTVVLTNSAASRQIRYKGTL